MPQLDPYLFFDGDCAEAMRFYERTLGAKLEALMTHAQSPMADQASPANADRIMHASLLIDGRRLMASDTMEGETHEGAKGFALSLTYPTVAEGRRAFEALAKGGQVRMAMEETFWAKAFGMVVDRFGTFWMINAEMNPF